MKKKNSSKKSPKVPESSEPDSNTKVQNKTPQIPPAKYWCFTFNNYTEEQLSSIKDICDICNFDYIIGKEVGEKGTPHLQGFIRYKTKSRPMETFKQFKGIHWEKTKSNFQANIDYCCKDGNYITNMKIPKKVKIYENIKNIFKPIEKMIQSEPDDRKIYWYYGKQGIGKTQFLKYLYVKYNALIVSGCSKNMKHAIAVYKANNDGCLPEIVISNLPFATRMDCISYSGYEEIKDMFFHSGKYEGDMICGNPPHLIIFANEPPETENNKFIVERLNPGF